MLRLKFPTFKLSRRIKKGFLIIFLLSTLLALLLLLIIAIGNFVVWQKTKSQIFTTESLTETYQVGIILGAKVYSDGTLSGMTQDRCDRAIELYKNKKVEKLLISGDHGQKTYDEVNTMKDYLLEKEIPAKDIFLDHAGFDTYDSIYRAKEIFQAKSAVIITQEFHLQRGLFIAQKLDLPAVGVAADIQDYGHMERVIIREKLAIMKAWMNVIFGAQPKFLGESIPLTGDSKASWDKDK